MLYGWANSNKSLVFPPLPGALLILIWAAILAGSTIAAGVVEYHDAPPLHWFDLFYRTGSLIFGGGQVWWWWWCVW